MSNSAIATHAMLSVGKNIVMFTRCSQIVAAVERQVLEDPSLQRSDVIRLLRPLGLSSFGELMFSLPLKDYPGLSRLLPSMASEQVQTSWTGQHGHILLSQSLDFALHATSIYSEITSERIHGKKILDFGCGYGRFARLFYYFSDEDQYYAVDPWQESIRQCQACGLAENFFLSDFQPKALPFSSSFKFDLIFAYSVFTHLSADSAVLCLNTLSRYLKENAVMLITIRPIEFWRAKSHLSAILTPDLSARMEKAHESEGFAFFSSGGVDDPAGNYGDSSIEIEWLQSSLPDLTVERVDYALTDPYQQIIALQRRCTN